MRGEGAVALLMPQMPHMPHMGHPPINPRGPSLDQHLEERLTFEFQKCPFPYNAKEGLIINVKAFITWRSGIFDDPIKTAFVPRQPPLKLTMPPMPSMLNQ